MDLRTAAPWDYILKREDNKQPQAYTPYVPRTPSEDLCRRQGNTCTNFQGGCPINTPAYDWDPAIEADLPPRPPAPSIFAPLPPAPPPQELEIAYRVRSSNAQQPAPVNDQPRGDPWPGDVCLSADPEEYEQHNGSVTKSELPQRADEEDVVAKQEKLKSKLDHDGWDFVGGKYGDGTDSDVVNVDESYATEAIVDRVDEEFDVVVVRT
ncbi:hypothetical protein M011DRAFT_49963 [Sporormia fimetaria CBS 119925]|uniref:Uncharacterized protein n=1 Tax=Sporormia fimetaria CBS 119925 TaxID=1340428 RepID=A0A6A6VBY2_9PLEO|nr:hypothetical protein M011DRAFT_49963 [Sporormia fimetaria CBS 119925]